MEQGTSYDVRVYRTEVHKGAKVTTYKVRWKTGGRLWKEGFRNAALADSFRSSLLTAARKGEAFSLSTGRPVSLGAGRVHRDLVRPDPRLRRGQVAVRGAESPQVHRRGAYRRHRGDAHQRRAVIPS